MPEIGEIDLKSVKGKYYIEDINLVDIRDLNNANEFRLYFEIFLSLGAGFLGATISAFNWYFFSATLLFFLLGIIFLVRYLMKYNKLRKKKSKKEYYTAELQAKYPKENNGRTFQLIKSNAKPRHIYLLDNTTNIKRHIGSSSTFQALGYDRSMVKIMDPNEFNLLKEGDKILIE